MGKDRLDEPLDLHNYSTWKLRFQLLCAELGYSRALLQAPIAEADVIISDKVKSVMAKNVKNQHLQTIVRAANAKAAWDALAATFASTCNTRKVALRQELSDFKMANGEELPIYISRDYEENGATKEIKDQLMVPSQDTLKARRNFTGRSRATTMPTQRWSALAVTSQ
ncbi:hypothetical protein VaNZ11_002958 [Volvox africanus]|uniref:DUF4219 domain-containing protein n=1 Tax=Volvox africanus TaxID=51714 RepID=A0ABQ5RTG0_9CHLO|nr:hypothetical protein VaNZ11_002958 [Volvox africanus]